MWKETWSYLIPCHLNKSAHNTLYIANTWLHNSPHYRDIQEDLENLYGRRQDLNYRQPELPTSHDKWRLFNGQTLEQGDHEDYFQSREGDFLQEFEQMFHNVLRGFQFDFNPPAQGSLNLIICRKHISVQLINCSVKTIQTLWLLYSQ